MVGSLPCGHGPGGSQLGSQLEAAAAAGIKVIAYDRLVKNTEAVDVYVAFDNFQVGVLQGTALLEGLGKRMGAGPYNIELIAGSPDDANATPFFEGAMSILQPKIDDGTLTVVSGQLTFEQVAMQGWEAENAQKRMDTVLSGFSTDAKLDGILSPNDTLGRAAMAAVAQAGKETPVVTGQGSEAEINDTKSYDNGKKIVPAYLLTPFIVTKENAAEVYASDSTLGPLTK